MTQALGTVEITFDRPTLERFKNQYKFAVRRRAADFYFEGRQFNTAFAKHLIEHLDPVIEMLDRNPFIYPSKRVD